MNSVDCKACRHFRTAPYQARKTGCWNPANMPVKQKEAFLDEQQTPGDHRRINMNADCEQFEDVPAKPSLFKRLFSFS
ncbi:MAG: hypothetical protein ACI841_004028 [Planctomycetota bacterium]|jgi:hypothetical protein